MSEISAAGRFSDTTDPQNWHHLSPADLSEQYRILVLFFYTIFHFFGDSLKMFDDITDPRDPQKIVYPPGVLAFAGILMFMCGLEARRQIGFLLRGDICADNFRALFGVPSCPHGDTINDAFALMDPNEFQSIVCRMAFCLIRKKVFYPCRLMDRYFVIAIDGTWTLKRKERHCPYCLTQTKNGKTTYYHMVLEAKLVTPDGFAVPLFTEFVENAGNDSKQDCELKAFYRMAERIKAQFPRLPIVVSIDGLFACGPVFEMCRKHNWKFMVVLKDRSLPTVNQEFESLSQLQAKNRLTRRVSDGKRSIEQTFRWVKEINYTDTEKNEHTLDVIECLETGEKAKGVACTKKFKWVTNLSASERNVVKLTYNGGRLRWKIENEGFNVQKNGGYGLTHMYSNNDNSSKIFHFLMQIAHLWMQLLVKGGMRRWFPKGVGSVKNVAFRLLEGWRNTHLPRGILQWITGWRFQIRFCFDTS